MVAPCQWSLSPLQIPQSTLSYTSASRVKACATQSSLPVISKSSCTLRRAYHNQTLLQIALFFKATMPREYPSRLSKAVAAVLPHHTIHLAPPGVRRLRRNIRRLFACCQKSERMERRFGSRWNKEPTSGTLHCQLEPRHSPVWHIDIARKSADALAGCCSSVVWCQEKPRGSEAERHRLWTHLPKVFLPRRLGCWPLSLRNLARLRFAANSPFRLQWI